MPEPETSPLSTAKVLWDVLVPPEVKHAVEEFTNVGWARKAFLAEVFGAPFKPPPPAKDDFDLTGQQEREEWSRGKLFAEAFVAAQLAEGVATSLGPPGPGAAPELATASGSPGGRVFVESTPAAPVPAADFQKGERRKDFEGGANMSAGDAEYQSRQGGLPKGEGLYVNGVQFDGPRGPTGPLIEAKNYAADGRIANALEEQEHWAGWKVLEQGSRQFAAAEGRPIEWRIASDNAARAIQDIFDTWGIPIKAVHRP